MPPGRETSPASQPVPTLSIIIPMYREAARIGATIADVHATLEQWQAAGATVFPCELLLMDDGSDDDTRAVAERAVHAIGRNADAAMCTVRVIPSDRNFGKGHAVRTGLAHARGEWVLMMDADNATRLREISKLVDRAHATRAEFLVGSRRTADAHVRATFRRRVFGWGFQLALSALGMRLARDTQCGFKLYSRRAADLVTRLGREDRFAFDIEHLALVHRAGLGIQEVGIVWTHQEGSTVHPVRDGLRMLRAAARLGRATREIPAAQFASLRERPADLTLAAPAALSLADVPRVQIAPGASEALQRPVAGASR